MFNFAVSAPSGHHPQFSLSDSCLNDSFFFSYDLPTVPLNISIPNLSRSVPACMRFGLELAMLSHLPRCCNLRKSSVHDALFDNSFVCYAASRWAGSCKMCHLWLNMCTNHTESDANT
jgi:hypothetical protein